MDNKLIPDDVDDLGNTHIIEHLFIYDTQTGDVLLNNTIADESPIAENTNEEHCKPTD